jgi:hypothetical protein
MSLLARFFRLPAADRSLLIRSACLLGVARIALWILPLQIARRVVARLAPRAPGAPAADHIGWAVTAARRVVPRATCLPQALAGEALLVRNGHAAELIVGVAKTPQGGLEAHAWVESGGRLVVGELRQGISRYTPLPPLPPLRKTAA